MESIQQVTEWHAAQDEKDEGRGEESAWLLISYDNIDTVAKQKIHEKIVEPIIKDNLPNPENLKRIDRMRLKEKTKVMDEVIDSVQTSSIIEGKKVIKCGDWVITQFLGIKEKTRKKNHSGKK